mgnify:CR=1 FL=1
MEIILTDSEIITIKNAILSHTDKIVKQINDAPYSMNEIDFRVHAKFFGDCASIFSKFNNEK